MCVQKLYNWWNFREKKIISHEINGVINDYLFIESTNYAFDNQHLVGKFPINCIQFIILVMFFGDA